MEESVQFLQIQTYIVDGTRRIVFWTEQKKFLDMYGSDTWHIFESPVFQPSKVFVCHPSYVTAGIRMKIPCYKFLCNLLECWCQFLPGSTERTWQGINPSCADIADETVDFTFCSLIMFFLHSTPEISVINLSQITIDDRLVKIHHAFVQMLPDHKIRPSYKQQLCGDTVPCLHQGSLVAFQQSFNWYFFSCYHNK